MSSSRVYCGYMDKRLAKRHKRQVSRERSKVKLSEPDLRTPEQIEAAREASRASINQPGAKGNQPKVAASGQGFRNASATSTGSAAKTGA
jgi:hypothetical protein